MVHEAMRPCRRPFAWLWVLLFALIALALQHARADPQTDTVEIAYDADPDTGPQGREGQPQGSYQRDRAVGTAPARPVQQAQVPLCPGFDAYGRAIVRPCLPGELPPPPDRRTGVQIPLCPTRDAENRPLFVPCPPGVARGTSLPPDHLRGRSDRSGPGHAACGAATQGACICPGGAKGHIPCDRSKGPCHCGSG